MTKDVVAAAICREVYAARDLVAALNDDDERLRHDMVEGETDLLEAIDAALAEIDECDVRITGCKAKEAEFKDRRTLAERRKERLRGLIEQALVVAEISTVKRPTATIIVKDVPPTYLITDESLIPARFWKQPDPVLDRASLKEAFGEGEDIPGVTATNGTTSLAIRRK